MLHETLPEINAVPCYKLNNTTVVPSFIFHADFKSNWRQAIRSIHYLLSSLSCWFSSFSFQLLT